ncbi:cysteine hydrolase family protein [Azospirillum argentinense]|uniref:Isochorismatase-like domain-containing protein n=1 Tax=Azospirillum argentinense TaxID=2970906 RepID=A0A5B0KQE6_9PROT|nr:cysteine hydrolase family protein [Azospirillum argentinense]KAA1054125.1 Isochorismatase [Azospirillum argentinense]
MSATPKTLLALAGAPATPSPLDSAALLLIDAQREYTEGALPLVGVEAAVAEAARLLERARKAGTPVFHIVHHGKPGGALFNPEGPLSGIVAPLIPLDGETVVVKHLPNAFAGTELDSLIRATGRKELIVAGFQTHMCVSSTVRAALDLGWRTTVVDAASATRDLPDGAGGVIPAEVLHRANLAALADRFAVVVKDSRAWA